MQIWCSYFRYTVTLFLECALFLARCNIICTPRETKKEVLGYRKKYIEEFVRGTSLFWLDTAPYSMWFSVAFFVFSRPLPRWCTCWMVSIKIHTNGMVGILFDDTMSERSRIWQYTTSWLASQGPWNYFRLCFSLSSPD